MVVIILPNEIIAVNPLATPLSSEVVVNIINIWLKGIVIGDIVEFPVRENNNSSFSLPPPYIFKFVFPFSS